MEVSRQDGVEEEKEKDKEEEEEEQPRLSAAV